MPYYISDFLEAHPAIELSMDVTNKEKVIYSLENNEVDFALVSVLPKHLDLKSIPLLKNSLYLVGGNKRIEKKREKKSQIFSQAPLLYREKGSATRNAMENFIENKNLPSTKKMELTSNEALKQAVIAGMGYSIMPLIGIKSALQNNDISIIPYSGLPITTEWNIVWRKEKKLSPAASAFIDYLKLEKENIQNTHFKWIESYK